MAPAPEGGATSKGTAGVTRLTRGTIASDASMATAPATIGDPKKGTAMLPTVKPTPTAKLAHTLAFDTRLLNRPQKSGPKKAPARAPHEMPMSWAMKVIVEWYCTSAIAADRATKTTTRPRIQVSERASDIFFTTLPLSRSSVSTDELVSTRLDRVDMLAERTRTTTRPTKRSGRLESIVGTIESKTGVPLGA